MAMGLRSKHFCCPFRVARPAVRRSCLNRTFSAKPTDHSYQLLDGYSGPSPLYQHYPSGLLSFLPNQPASPQSPTVLGTLSALRRFDENPSFLELLHSVLAAAYLNDAHVHDLARARKSTGADSFLHVLDERIPRSNSTDRQPASIIFSFLADSTTGRPVPDTYQPNPALRIYTPLDGFLVLPKSLHFALLRGCEIARSIEEDSSS